MNSYSVFIYFLAALIMAGALLLLFYRLRHAIADMESKVTGIWSNADGSLRTLIYSSDSGFHGEIVWTRNLNDRILGVQVIRDLELHYFGWSTGVYIDPVTNREFQLQLKLKHRGKLTLQIIDPLQKVAMRVEEWTTE